MPVSSVIKNTHDLSSDLSVWHCQTYGCQVFRLQVFQFLSIQDYFLNMKPRNHKINGSKLRVIRKINKITSKNVMLVYFTNALNVTDAMGSLINYYRTNFPVPSRKREKGALHVPNLQHLWYSITLQEFCIY